MTTRTANTDAHFLHVRPLLEALVSPGVEHPRALAWVPGEEALVLASQGGALTLFEPAFGTRALGSTLPDPARIAVDFGWLAVLDSAGILDVARWPDLTPAFRVETALVGRRSVVCWAAGVAVIGEDAGGVRRVLVYDDRGRAVGRVRVPARTALGVGADGALVLARSTAEGVSLTPFGRPLPAGEATAHALRVNENLAILGIAAGGVTVWRRVGEPPVTVKAFDVSAGAVSPDGENVALGTRIGRVAYASTRPGTTLRANPTRVEGHDHAVFAVEFSRRGRWLATCAERCWVWSY